MSLFNKLLNMLGRRTTCSGLKQTAALDKRDNGQHFGAGAQLQNREEIGQVIPQNVAGRGDRILTRFGAFQGVVHGIDRRHGLDVQTVGIVIL